MYLEMSGKTLFMNFMCDDMLSVLYQLEVSPWTDCFCTREKREKS